MSPEELARVVADNIRRERAARSLSQKQLAEMAKLKQSFIARIESGKQSPNLSTVADIAGALGVPPATLLIGDLSPAT